MTGRAVTSVGTPCRSPSSPPGWAGRSGCGGQTDPAATRPGKEETLSFFITVLYLGIIIGWMGEIRNVEYHNDSSSQEAIDLSTASQLQ